MGGSIQPELITRALVRLCKRLEVPHDFRRTGAATLTSERCGVRRVVVSKVLGHASYDGGAAVTEVYDLNDYLPEKRTALRIWGRYVLALAAVSEAWVRNLGPDASFAAPPGTSNVFTTPAANDGRIAARRHRMRSSISHLSGAPPHRPAPDSLARECEPKRCRS